MIERYYRDNLVLIFNYAKEREHIQYCDIIARFAKGVLDGKVGDGLKDPECSDEVPPDRDQPVSNA